MKPDVAGAIEELKRAFPSSTVTVNEDGQGGVYVFVETVDIGTRFMPSITWMGGHIPALYPYADIYPVFIDAAVCRTDGQGFDTANNPRPQFCRADLQSKSLAATIRSRTAAQTAVAKFVKILDFLEKLP